MGGMTEDTPGDVLRDAWVEFLRGFQWQVYFTQTYEQPTFYAHVAINRALGVLKQFAKEYNLGDWWAFIAAEEHKSGAFHAHGLLGARLNIWDLPHSLRRMWEIGKNKYGLCRYETIDTVGGVIGYVSKYVTKDLVDWRIVGRPLGVDSVRRLL